MEATSRHVAGIPRWFLVSALLILFIPVATFLLNQSTVHNLILRLLKSQVGIEMSAVHVQLIPKISLEVFDLLVRDDRNDEPILRAPQASLSLRFWPLLTKQLPMLELSAVEPELVIRRDRDGVWHIPLADEKNTNQTDTSSSHKWVITDFHVIDGSLLILDEDRLAAGGVRVHQVQATFQSNQAQTHAEVRLAGKTEDGGDLLINGYLALAKKGGSDTTNMVILPARFEGTFHFQHFDLAYWFGRTGQSVAAPRKETAWRGNISSAINLEFLPGTQGFNVAISDLSTDLDWLVIRGNMVVQSAGTDHPAYAVRLSTSPVNSDTFFRHVPPSWIPKNVHDSVAEHDLKGTVELVSVALRGQINVLREPDEWQMIAKLSNGSGVWGEKRTRIHNLSATVALDPQRADITELAGEVNKVQITSSKLTVSDLALRPTLDAHLLGIGKIEHVLAVLRQFGGGTVGSPILRSITDPTGTLQMAVHLAGPVVPKPSLRLIMAEVRVQDLGVRLAKNFSVAQLNGSIAADSRLLGVQNMQGVMQGIHFEAEGAVDLESGARVTNFTMHMSSDGTAIRQLLATKFTVPPDVRIEGPAHAILSLSGTAGAAHCRSTIDLTGTELLIPSVLHKKKGIPGRLEFEAKIIDGKHVIVDDFKLALQDSQLQAAGQIELGPTPKFHVQMKAGPVSLRALADMGVTIPITDGVLETSAMISGEGTDWKLWTPSGWVSVRNGIVTLPGLVDKLSEVSGRLQVTKRGAMLDELAFKIGGSDVKVTGMIERWRHHPRATFMVESSELDVTKFVSKTNGNQATASGNLQDWFQSKEATITFLIKQLQYERLVLRTVSGEIKLDSRKAKLNALRGETPKGVLFGQGEARLGPRQRMDIDADVRVDGIPAQDLLSPREGETTEPLQGNLSLNGVMQATVSADTPIQNTLSTARHGIKIKVTNGRLQQDPVLTKVLKILNIPAVLVGQVDLDHGGIPFHSLSARVVARNGLLSSEDIVFESPIIKVTGAGTADMKENGLDLALAVSPVAAYSDLIDKIPLFGPFLEGDHPGLSTALFEAKGSFHDPEVSYLPLESFGKGLTGYPRLAVDVLVNSIKLPQTALANATQ
jgi:AsmA-like C-terminal region